MKNFPFPIQGSISTGTLRVSEVLDSFLSALRRLGGKLQRADANKIRRMLDRDESDWTEEESDFASELLSEVQDRLQGYAPECFYFGTSQGDGADFGFFFDSELFEMERRDCPDDFVNDLSEAEARGNLRAFVVNDHGNVSLFVRKSARAAWREVWSVV